MAWHAHMQMNEFLYILKQEVSGSMYPHRRGHCLSIYVNRHFFYKKLINKNRQLACYLLYAHPGILRALSL